MSLNLLKDDEHYSWVKNYYDEFFIEGIDRAYNNGIITLKEKDNSISFFKEGIGFNSKTFDKLKEYCPEFSIDNLAKYCFLLAIEIHKEMKKFFH